MILICVIHGNKKYYMIMIMYIMTPDYMVQCVDAAESRHFRKRQYPKIIQMEKSRKSYIQKCEIIKIEI